jgi:transcriptional regulator GlxA family with amidase domain
MSSSSRAAAVPRDQPHEELVAWIQQVHQTTRWTTSVCTGALLLGEADILDGLRATTHVVLRSLARRLYRQRRKLAGRWRSP